MIARLLRLYRPYTGWLLLGTLLALIALLAVSYTHLRAHET